MAWIKVPKDHHPLFMQALPKDKRVTTMPMFGGICAVVNGNMFGGLFGRSIVVRLDDAGVRDALELDGAAPFDPMGRGVAASDKIMMPESAMDDTAEMRTWLQRALESTAKLPHKAKAKPKAKPAAKRPAAKPKRRATR